MEHPSLALIKRLIKFTKQDKIKWENDILDIHKAVYVNNEIVVEFPQDEPPYIMFNHKHLQMRGAGIEILLSEIRKQYERQDRNGCGPTAKKRHQDADEARQEAARKEAKDFADAASKFLADEKSKKRQ